MTVELVGKVLGLVDQIEDLDDVKNVYSNAEFAAEIMEHLE